jgi:hypothetical protein
MISFSLMAMALPTGDSTDVSTKELLARRQMTDMPMPEGGGDCMGTTVTPPDMYMTDNPDSVIADSDPMVEHQNDANAIVGGSFLIAGVTVLSVGVIAFGGWKVKQYYDGAQAPYQQLSK